MLLWLQAIAGYCQEGQGDAEVASNVEGGFSITNYDETTNQIRSKISASSATAKGRDRFALSEMLLETFTYRSGKSKVEARVRAPECLFDNREQRASSAGSIHVSSEDGLFQLRGEGWSWSQESGTLVISNKISTEVRLDKSEQEKVEHPAPPVRVSSGLFRYDLNRGAALYEEGVNLEDPGRMNLKTDQLNASIESLSSDVKQIEANGNVTIEVLSEGRQGRITGQKAVYRINSNEEVLVDIGGHPSWSFPEADGTADQLSINATQQSYVAEGNGELLLKELSLSAGSGFGNPGMKRLPSKVRIRFEKGSLTPESARFQGSVKADQGESFQLNCEDLTAEFDQDSGSGGRLSARGMARLHIRMEEGFADVQGDAMDYSEDASGQSKLNVLGRARWNSNEYSGSSDSLEIRWQDEYFQAAGNARLYWSPDCDSPGNPTEKNTTSNRVMVSADSYTLQGNSGHFEGHLEVTHPDWRLTGGVIDLDLDPESRTIRKAVARRDVVLTLNSAHQTAAKGNTQIPPGLDALGELGRFDANWTLKADELNLEMNPNDQSASVEARGQVYLLNLGNFAQCGLLDWEQSSGILILGSQPVIKTGGGVVISGGKWTTFALNSPAKTFTARGAYEVSAPIRNHPEK